MLLLHGAGASTHSFRDLAPLLAERFRVVAPDLPGHGFSRVGRGASLSLEAMARAIEDLVRALDLEPDLVVGHSAGAAIGLKAILDGRIDARLVVGLNPALLPLRGVASRFFSPAARFVARRPLASRLAAWTAADRRRVARTLEGTGSRLDARGVDLYQRLARNPAHVAGTVQMMAEWDLGPLRRELRRLERPLVMIVGDQDRAVPPSDAREVARLVRAAEVVTLPRLGHLAHEEAPATTRDIIVGWAARHGLRVNP
jgi:magnesium chelatase accessory protein